MSVVFETEAALPFQICRDTCKHRTLKKKSSDKIQWWYTSDYNKTARERLISVVFDSEAFSD